MGRLRNLVSAKVSGNVGSMNFREREAGQIVVAERSYSNASKGNGASEAQRMQRCKLANLVAMYDAIKAIQQRAWENRKANSSYFNCLVKYNLTNSPVLLTKQEAEMRSCVIAPYEVSRGSLKTINLTNADDVFTTDIAVDAQMSIENTQGTLAQDIISRNPDFKNGDKISIAILSQYYQENDSVQYPKVNVNYVEYTLDTTSVEPISNIAGLSVTVMTFDSGFIAFEAADAAAFVVHSRLSGGKLLTSQQFIIMSDMAMLNAYSSMSQEEKAMESYGYKGKVLLVPGETDSENVTGEKATVNNVLYDGANVASGSTYNAGKVLTITGTGLTRQNVQVTRAGVVLVPQTDTATRFTYTLGTAGDYKVIVNGSIVATFTIAGAESGITKIVFNGQQSTTPQQNVSATENSSVSIRIEGTGLGQMTATGATLSNVNSSDTLITASVMIPDSGSTFTISVGGQVVVSGTATAGGGGSDII